MHFDYIIVGKGLVGSATAKYLARSGSKVAIIGPDEPEVPSSGEVFASHYDSSRIQRQIGRNRAMTALNLQALKEYPQLQRDSGIKFHYPVGCLYVNSNGTDSYMENTRSEDRSNINRTLLGYHDLREIFPYFKFPDRSVGLFEDSPSGCVNPRRLIAAQLNILQKHYGTLVPKVVRTIEASNQNVAVVTSDDEKYTADKVIIATGAFTNLYQLLSKKLALTLKSETVLLAKADKINQGRLSKIPSLLYEIETDHYEGAYLTPPALYPDGQIYLKIGCNLTNDIYFDYDLDTIQKWFQGNDHAINEELLLDLLRSILPGHEWTDTQTKPCILTRTARHGNPYIDLVDDLIVVAIGNGYSAMCSDGIGFVAAYLAQHLTFPPGVNRGDYRPAYQ